MEISGFDIISILQFYYRSTMDKHQKCKFTLSVREKTIPDYQSYLGNQCTIKDDDFEFSGIITKVIRTRNISGTTLKVTVQGNSIDFDKQKKFRVFQYEQKKVSDILKYSMPDIQCNADVIIKPIIVQQEETDWQFIKRLAKYLGKHIFWGKEKWFGEPKGIAIPIEENDILAIKEVFNIKGNTLVCQIRKKLELGQKISYYKKEYFVKKVEYMQIRARYIYQYYLQEILQETDTTPLPNYYLTAKVKQNQDNAKMGRVCVEFCAPYEDVMAKKAMWLDCDTFFASKDFGMVCIPSIGDIVSVQIHNEKASVQSVKRTEAYSKQYSDCNTKYILIDENTHFEINDKHFYFDNNHLKFEISKEEMLVQLDKIQIQIKNDAILFHTDKTDIALSSGTKIKTEEIQIEGKNNFNVIAEKVNIQGKSGVSIN